MLRVKNYLAPSTIHGIGVFATGNISKDVLVWSFEENFDRRFTADEFFKLSSDIMEYYETYGYKSSLDSCYYLPLDNDRFMNHSERPNTYFGYHGNFYAIRSIKKGEEITCNYREFDANWETYLPAMLNEVRHARKTA